MIRMRKRETVTDSKGKIQLFICLHVYFSRIIPSFVNYPNIEQSC